MRLILRIIGTTLLAAALILGILDGTRSLGQSAVVITSLGANWEAIHAPSLAALHEIVDSRLGRSQRTRVFVKQNQI